MTSTRKRMFSVALAGCIALVSLALGEVALRIYNHNFPSFIFFDDTYNRFRGKPHLNVHGYPLNAHGFKDEEFGPRRPGRYRILGIGDSFAYGVVPYPHNYLTLLETRLADVGIDAEVLNMGIPNLGPPDYLSLLVHEGLALEPDMVLLSFFIGNDIFESASQARSRTLISRSHVLTLLRYLATVPRHFEGQILPGETEYCDTCPNFDEAKFLEIETERGSLYLADHPVISGYFEDAVGQLARIKSVCDRAGIDLLVILIPDELQVNPELEAAVRARHDLRTWEWDIDRPNRFLGEQLRALQVDTRDLLPAFSRGSREEVLYRPRDTHWNIAGNRLGATLIAEQVAPRLQARSTLP